MVRNQGWGRRSGTACPRRERLERGPSHRGGLARRGRWSRALRLPASRGGGPAAVLRSVMEPREARTTTTATLRMLPDGRDETRRRWRAERIIAPRGRAEVEARAAAVL